MNDHPDEENLVTQSFRIKNESKEAIRALSQQLEKSSSDTIRTIVEVGLPLVWNTAFDKPLKPARLDNKSINDSLDLLSSQLERLISASQRSDVQHAALVEKIDILWRESQQEKEARTKARQMHYEASQTVLSYKYHFTMAPAYFGGWKNDQANIPGLAKRPEESHIDPVPALAPAPAASHEPQQFARSATTSQNTPDTAAKPLPPSPALPAAAHDGKRAGLLDFAKRMSERKK